MEDERMPEPDQIVERVVMGVRHGDHTSAIWHQRGWACSCGMWYIDGKWNPRTGS